MISQFDRSEAFDRNWCGPEEMKPRCYRNQTEKDTWYSIAVENEYRAGELQPNDVVIDVGANIGAFSWLAYQKGSRSVYAFEIDPWNFEGLIKNTQGMEDGIATYHCAMVRGDEHRSPEYHYTGNWNSFSAIGPVVPSRSLDEIISQVGEVRFLKMDCEGCEWPILYTATMLDKVREIAGEYHLIGQLDREMQNLPLAVSTNDLQQFLESKGFTVEIKQNSTNIGNFYAKRITG